MNKLTLDLLNNLDIAALFFALGFMLATILGAVTGSYYEN